MAIVSNDLLDPLVEPLSPKELLKAEKERKIKFLGKLGFIEDALRRCTDENVNDTYRRICIQQQKSSKDKKK